MELNETWQDAKSQCLLPSMCFSGRWEKQDGRTGLWLAETFSDFPLKPLNKIQQNLTGSKILTSSTNLVFFRAGGKNKMTVVAWDIFDFSSETFEFNETWHEAESQRPLPISCFSGRWRKQEGRPDLWLAKTFSASPLKPLNGIQRDLTGSNFSTSSTMFMFSRPIRKNGYPGEYERNKRKCRKGCHQWHDIKEQLHIFGCICIIIFR